MLGNRINCTKSFRDLLFSEKLAASTQNAGHSCRCTAQTTVDRKNYSSTWDNTCNFSVVWLQILFIIRGLSPLLALLVKPRSQRLRALQAMLAKFHLFLANIKQILIRFAYMRDQEKKMRASIIYLGTFPLNRPKSCQVDFGMEYYLIGYNIVITYNITTHV